MNQKLIISKMNVNVVADYAIDANALLLQIRSQLQHVILVELDKIINREQLSDVKINTLNLDFNTPSIDAWKDELPKAIHKEIQKKSKDITIIETVINLLKNKEVNQYPTAIPALEEQIIASGKIKNFTDRIFKEVGLLKEALSAFSDSFLLEMVTELSKERVIVLGKIITETKSVQKEKAWIQKVTQRVDQIFSDLFIKIKAKSTSALQELLKKLQEQTHFFYIADSNLQTVFIETERLTPSIFITSFCEIIPDEKQLKLIQKEVEKITTSTSNEFKEALKVKSKELKDTIVDTEDSIVLEENTSIVNAGVVLLHPFLPMLFQNLGLVSDKNEWISEEHQIAAIYLIHYIATGNMIAAIEEENAIEESKLLIGKLLTGYPLETPILNFSNNQTTNGETKLIHPLLSNLELIYKELDEVLNALQNNWKPMKNCSWNGLRNDFLSRTGTLERNNKQQTITITPHTFDIQLQFLPWGIGIVKLSWMEEMVDVVWK